MTKRPLAVLCAATVAASVALQPAAAQYRGDPPRSRLEQEYRDGYRDGYRAGFDDARAGRRFDNDRFSGRYDDRRDDPAERWRERYDRTYTYNDDVYYRECRQQVDPAGVIAGALIGGLLGNVIGQGGGRGGATVAGVVLGGVAGAALTRNLDCEDRSYAYRTYHTAFNEGRPNRDYEWRNPRNNHRGVVRVGEYYDDPYGFRCTTFSQTIYIQGRPQEARGRACRQPDGTWTIVE